MSFFYCCDLLGIAVFACSGALMAGRKSMDLFGVLVISMVAGGMMRDVICNKIPLVLQREIDATAAIAGAAGFTLLIHLGAGRPAASLFGMAIVFGLRVCAMYCDWALPRFHLAESPPTSNRSGDDSHAPGQ